MWEHLLQATKDQDKHATDAWKDDLNNLLIVVSALSSRRTIDSIFLETGLFSSVVTAFTVQSDTLFPPAPGGSTGQSAIRVVEVSPYLSGPPTNSTVSPLLLPNVGDTPASMTVAPNVNTLWVTSLTLSLLVALYALAVQQWLRHAYLSPDLETKTALRVRQLHQESFRAWQVPGIISLLPVILQIAVVLFLGGLLELLKSSNSSATAPFMIVAGCGLSLFFIASLVPLLNVLCAYKSPLIPTALLVVQWMTYPVAILVSIPYVVITWISGALPLRLCSRFPNAYHTYLNCVYWPRQQLVAYIRSFGTHIRVDPRSFWSNKELRVVASDTDLECRAFLSSLIAMPESTFSRLKELALDYAPSTRMRSTLLVVIRPLGLHRAEDVLKYHPRLSGDSRLRRSAQYCIPPRHVELLLDSLAVDWTCDDPLQEHDVPRILYLLHYATLNSSSADLRERVSRILLQIRTVQSLRPFDLASARHAVPTVLLFERASAAKRLAKEGYS